MLLKRLLEIRNLKTWFRTDDGMVRAVDGVDLSVDRGETLAVVGESGCGKTVTARSVLKLIDMPPGRFEAGEIVWQGRDLIPLSPAEMDQIRAREIAMVFQEPMTSLNPVYTVGEQIGEIAAGAPEAVAQGGAGRGGGHAAAGADFQSRAPRARLPAPVSGGMRQRVMIAMALVCRPQLLIADEPTTALDVTIQAQILDLLLDMKSRFGMSVMLITHAMGVVAENAQRVVVMYAGKVVEQAPVEELFAHPHHPYTQGLIRSIPRMDKRTAGRTRLSQIPGFGAEPAASPGRLPLCRSLQLRARHLPRGTAAVARNRARAFFGLRAVIPTGAKIDAPTVPTSSCRRRPASTTVLDLHSEVVDSGPSPAMTRKAVPMSQSLCRLVLYQPA